MQHLFDIIRKRIAPGILIFDLNNRLLYSNRAALQVIPGLEEKGEQGQPEGCTVPEEILSLCNQLKIGRHSEDPVQRLETTCSVMAGSSERQLSLRAFFVGDHGKSHDPGYIMVLVEGITEKRDYDFEIIRKDFALSKRETEVVKLICQGLSNRRIAEKLFISEYTVKDHIKKIMEKMHVASRNEIIASLK